MEELKKLEEDYKLIIKEKLGADSKVVFGEGNPNADIVLIGEAPGEKEEEIGRPFVGQAGKNLDEFLNILEIKRDDIYITNVVKIRPYKVNPDTGRKSNRPPDKKEVEVSLGTLNKQLQIIRPKVVVTLGNVPLKAVTGDDNAKIGDYHGNPLRLEGFVLFPLYHPASIIYNRALKEIYNKDVYKLKEYLKTGGM